MYAPSRSRPIKASGILSPRIQDGKTLVKIKELSLEHYRVLSEGSGITDEVIELRPYKTVTEPKELLALGFSRIQANNVPGLLLPVNCTDGTNGLAVYRPDLPRVVQDRNKRNRDGSFKEKVIKYEMPPRVGVRLDCPRICRSNGGIVDPDKPLWITEGQKKADALASRGLIAIALLGVWNFKGQNTFGGVSLLADFDYVTWKSRDVRIVFDSDVMVKPGVRKALERLTEHLQRKGAHVAAVYLPMNDGEKVGVDDYLRVHSVEDLEGLIEGPRPVPKVAPPTIELLEDEPLSMSRPIALINGRAYVAIWPRVKIVKTETLGSNGDIIKFDQPMIDIERRPLVMREDGKIFSIDDDDNSGFEPMPDLEFRLDTIPESKHLWSTGAIKRYREKQFPEPPLVFRRICEIVSHYIDFDRSLADQSTMAEMIACYILATWMLDAFQVIGYLYPNGEFGSGKSELLNTVTQMAFMGEMVMAQSTIATIRDAADYGATLAFDEVERLQQDKTKADLMAILLAGNRKGTTLAAKEPSSKEGKWTTRRFNCYCPRLFAAQRLPDGALATRSIVVPLIRSTDPNKPNRMVTAIESWPHPCPVPGIPPADDGQCHCGSRIRQILIDDLWALSLGHLRRLTEFDNQIAARARLKGRQLEPWRAILAIALWLDSEGTENVYERMHALALTYQGESADLDSTNLTKLVIRSLDILLDEAPPLLHEDFAKKTSASTSESQQSLYSEPIKGADVFADVFQNADVFPAFSCIVKTSEIVSACHRIMGDEELPIKEESVNNRSIGWIMKRLRFKSERIGHKQARGWGLRRSEIERYKIAFGLAETSAPAENVCIEDFDTDSYTI